MKEEILENQFTNSRIKKAKEKKAIEWSFLVFFSAGRQRYENFIRFDKLENYSCDGTKTGTASHLRSFTPGSFSQQ